MKCGSITPRKQAAAPGDWDTRRGLTQATGGCHMAQDAINTTTAPDRRRVRYFALGLLFGYTFGYAVATSGTGWFPTSHASASKPEESTPPAQLDRDMALPRWNSVVDV